MFANHFRQRYVESLSYYKFFYDDFDTYGSTNASRAIYFVPGFNGVPGQIRFLFPSLTRLFGTDFYLKALNLPEFSARLPTWDKYVLVNVDKKRRAIIDDLSALLGQFERVTVLASSNGFYDFIGAMCEWNDKAAEKRLTLGWGPCAPDQFLPSLWDKVFFPLNGVLEHGFRWFAYPNHRLLKVLNPETTPRYTWRYDRQTRVLLKNDLESRFIVGGLYWDYASSDCFNAVLLHMLQKITRPLTLDARVLVPTNDGFWQGRTVKEIEAVVSRYLTNYKPIYRPESHLWVVKPDNMTDFLSALPLATAEASRLKVLAS